MSTPRPTPRNRSWWPFALYGLAAVGFGLFTLFQPESTVLAMVMGFGVLALVDGAISLFSVFRKDIALPNWLLLVYAASSIAFGVLALLDPRRVAEVLVWLLALWLMIAGLSRIVFAVQLRHLLGGNWLLALSGVLAALLGVLFVARPGLALATVAFWVAIGALVYGGLQLALAWWIRRRARAAIVLPG